MQELRIVHNARFAQHDVIVGDFVVLHELEEGLDRVPGPKVVGSSDIDLLEKLLERTLFYSPLYILRRTQPA